MAGIIIYIPPIIPTPPINPTSEIIPVNSAGTFIDSNIKNVVDDVIQTQNALDDQIGLKIDFTNNLYEIGNPLGLNINLDTANNILNINGDIVSNPTLIADKFLYFKNDGTDYWLQLYVQPPTP